MGCISVSTRRLDGITASVERLDGISVSTGRIGGINVSVGLICEVGAGMYLRVEPKEVQWVDVNLSVDYSVYANVDWDLE